MVNEENFNAWIQELRTTTKKQGKHLLKYVSVEGGETHYCCLGIGCELAGLEEEYNSYSGTSFFNGYPTLAPPAFLRWLGLLDKTEDEVDIYPDWPAGLSNEYGRYASDLSAAGMNDAGFTFAQIADVFAYFGIREDDE